MLADGQRRRWRVSQGLLVIRAVAVLLVFVREDRMNPILQPGVAPEVLRVLVVASIEEIRVHDSRIDRDLSGRSVTSSRPVIGMEAVMLAKAIRIARAHLSIRNSDVHHRLASDDVEVFNVSPREIHGVVGRISWNCLPR